MCGDGGVSWLGGGGGLWDCPGKETPYILCACFVLEDDKRRIRWDKSERKQERKEGVLNRNKNR